MITKLKNTIMVIRQYGHWTVWSLFWPRVLKVSCIEQEMKQMCDGQGRK